MIEDWQPIENVAKDVGSGRAQIRRQHFSSANERAYIEADLSLVTAQLEAAKHALNEANARHFRAQDDNARLRRELDDAYRETRMLRQHAERAGEQAYMPTRADWIEIRRRIVHIENDAGRTARILDASLDVEEGGEEG